MRDSCLDIKTVKYIIAAFTMDDEAVNDCQALDVLTEKIYSVQHDLLNNHKKTGLRM